MLSRFVFPTLEVFKKNVESLLESFLYKNQDLVWEEVKYGHFRLKKNILIREDGKYLKLAVDYFFSDKKKCCFIFVLGIPDHPEYIGKEFITNIENIIPFEPFWRKTYDQEDLGFLNKFNNLVEPTLGVVIWVAKPYEGACKVELERYFKNELKSVFLD